MRSRHDALLIAGLAFWALSAGPAPAAAPAAATEPATASVQTDSPLHHDNPAFDLHAAGALEPARTGSLRELDLPAPPEAAVTISLRDLLPGAIQLRLADTKTHWPARLTKRDRDAIASAYAARSHAPFWVGTEGWTEKARSVMARLAHGREDGLDPGAYATPTLKQTDGGAVAQLAEADIRLSAAAALYARDARGGRIDPTRLSALLTPTLDLPAADAVLDRLAGAADPGAALGAYNPHHPGYLALKAKLAELRAGAVATRPAPSARHRSGFEFTTQSIAILDDSAPSRAVERKSPNLEGEIIANMERWRWLPAELGERYVAVNVPEYRLRLFEGGRVVHETRVITGKPDSPTPIFSGLMEYAIVNPSWYLPPSILKNEFLPRLAADPSYAARQGYQVVRRGNVISVRQPPGERNALGFIKFMFPNRHAVYLHDTPNRQLFAGSRRALSHGCVRVEDPFRLADFVLGSAWSETRLKRLIGHGERTLFLPQKLPVHLMYFTLEIDGSGEMKSFEDIYGYDRRIRAALGPTV